MKILDNMQREVIHLSRPLRCQCCCCPCCLQEIEVQSPPGTVIGYVEQKWAILTEILTVKLRKLWTPEKFQLCWLCSDQTTLKFRITCQQTLKPQTSYCCCLMQFSFVVPYWLFKISLFNVERGHACTYIGGYNKLITITQKADKWISEYFFARQMWLLIKGDWHLFEGGLYLKVTETNFANWL